MGKSLIDLHARQTATGTVTGANLRRCILYQFRNISRYRAASVHLAISAVIALAVISTMLVLWYPGTYFSAMGGKLLVALIVGVDVIIGPIITLIIFDTRKKELVFDLAVVAALQLAALIYGTHTMYIARPVFTVFTGQQFVVVVAAEIDPKEQAKARFEEFRSFSLTGPRLVATEPPTKREDISDLLFAKIFGLGIQNLPKFYVPYVDKRDQILKASLPLSALSLQGKDKETLENYLRRFGHKKEYLRYLPVTAKDTVFTAIIDSNGDVLDMLDISPGSISNASPLVATPSELRQVPHDRLPPNTSEI